MEKMLVQTVMDRELGDTIANLRRLPAKLERLLNDKAYRTRIKKNMEKVSNKDFEKNFKKIIADFFADREAALSKKPTKSKQEPAINIAKNTASHTQKRRRKH
jgi:hypothetical protein